jgi:hypothetical protein
MRHYIGLAWCDGRFRGAGVIACCLFSAGRHGAKSYIRGPRKRGIRNCSEEHCGVHPSLLLAPRKHQFLVHSTRCTYILAIPFCDPALPIRQLISRLFVFARIMTVKDFAIIIKSSLSSTAGIFTDESSDDFKHLNGRWSNIGLKTPGAILQPASEDDVVKIVGSSSQLFHCNNLFSSTGPGKSCCQMQYPVCTCVGWPQCMVHDRP